MKKEQNHVNYRRLEIIRRVATLCTEDQIEKIEDFIFELWNQEEEQERKEKAEFEAWKEKKAEEEKEGMPF
tara:strand:- start:476 stop:688 length:213 start_codon:yes stop_codon:yes gene_type:complete